MTTFLTNSSYIVVNCLVFQLGLINVNEHETNSQNLVKEKLTEYTAITPMCRSSLLVELMNEMTELKQELDDRLGIVVLFVYNAFCINLVLLKLIKQIKFYFNIH